MEKAVSSTIQPETILRELSELWVSLAKDSEPGQSSGVLRACAMTLVTAVDESEDATSVWSTVAALMPEHPSRAIVIRFRQAQARELSARVFSQCWMPFGQRRQICCEQIEITASDASLPDLPAVIVPLAVSDLPVILWCRGSRLFSLPEFPELIKVANKVVLDAAVFPDPVALLRQIAEHSRQGQVFGDLTWTRLTRWRELVSQIFENRSYLARLPSIERVRIGFGGDAKPASGYYLAAWLLDCLETAGSKARVEWEPAMNARVGELARVELVGAGDDGLRASIAVAGDGERHCAEVRVGFLSNRTMFPPDNDYVLLREELSIPGGDPVYVKALAGASRLATAENN
jgi:glucose-6-phosphate dehydrogenase assembly protein OpcA